MKLTIPFLSYKTASCDIKKMVVQSHYFQITKEFYELYGTITKSNSKKIHKQWRRFRFANVNFFIILGQTGRE